MRDLTKAATLLLSLPFAFPLVIPESPGSRSSNHLVEHHQSEALLKFHLGFPKLQDEGSTLTFRVGVAEQQCGGSNITVNGQPLLSQWNGPKAWGMGTIRLEEEKIPIRASWQIVCLSSVGLFDYGNFLDQDSVQVLTLQIEKSPPAINSGFTVSYREFQEPRIVQFDPGSKNIEDIIEHASFWSTPSQDLVLASSTSLVKVDDEGFMQNLNGQQKSLNLPEMLGHLIQWEVKIVKDVASKAIKSCQHNFSGIHESLHILHEKFKGRFCSHQQHSLSAFLSNSSHPAVVPPNKLLGVSPQSHQAPTTVTGPLLSTSDLPSPVASQTRSLFSSTPTSSSSFSRPEASSSPQFVKPIYFSDSRIYHIKVLGIIVILASCLTWLIIRIRDPRRRADRAARREERRNIRLYRRAAQIQKWRNWAENFQNWAVGFQRKYWPVSRVVDSWDEKRTRVIDQESILEGVMKDEIGALTAAHRLASGISAAEEGRNSYIYEAESSEGALERRRSLTTLPGYESEGTQPPGYEDRYRQTGSEDSTPDSSVISTSPRISRDGRDSDFEKEIEWTLESSPPFSESRAPFGFRSVV